MDSGRTKTGSPGGPTRNNDEAAPETGAEAKVRAPKPSRETQPLFLQQYWQQYAQATPSAEVGPAPPLERPPSTADGELVDLDSLDDVAPEKVRDPIPSVMVGLSEFDDALPALPGSHAEGDAELMAALDKVQAESGLDDEDEEDAKATGQFAAVSLPEPPPAEELEEDEERAPTRPAEDVAKVLAGLELVGEEGSGEIDVTKTAQFKGTVIADDVDTSIWDFSAETMRQRTGEVGGEIIADRYRIIEPLAAGGMARIYRVRHVNLGKEFALKIIHADLSSDAHMRKAFIREARVSSLFDHPNIVQVTDFGVDDHHGAYIVMEFLKGETLHDRLNRSGRLRQPLALDITLQVAEALHYMHQQNIIHCDIKPENIFLAEPPKGGRRRVVVKLIDFGLSRREALGAQLASSEVGGTPHFMAPEQIRGKAPQPSMDIYSLGILFYEMLVGQLPFDGEINEILNAQLHSKPTPPSTLLEEELDEYVDGLILKALEKEPDDRQPSMGQLIFELRTVMEMLGFRSPRRRAEQKRPSFQESATIDEMLRVFERCPCPLFRIDTEPKIVVANRAFRVFVGGAGDDPVGKPLDTTRLGRFYPNLRMDVLAAALNKTPVQRVLTYEKAGQRPVSVMIWLVPEVDESSGVTTFIGIIVPMGGVLGGR